MPAVHDTRLVSVSPIELHFEDHDGKVRVVAPDRHVMIVPVSVAVEACRAFQDQIAFNDQFSDLLDRLARWIVDHKVQVSQAFLTVHDAGLLFLVIQQSTEFSPDLENSLSELSLEIANDTDYSPIRLVVHALPNCGREIFEAFLSSRMSLRYGLPKSVATTRATMATDAAYWNEQGATITSASTI